MKKFTLSPNPASNLLQESNLTLGIDNKILILDSNNRKLIQISENSTESRTIDVSTLPSGIYFILVKSGSSVETQKFEKI